MHATLLLSSLVLLSSLAQGVRSSSGRVLHEWNQLTFQFASTEEELAATQNGTYIAANCALTGIKIWNNVTFLTVPRWYRGVPATLATVDPSSGKLVAFPSFAAQDLADCSAIQYVQSMEIDRHGIMWVLDVGRKYINEFTPDNTCPPKMVLLDLNRGGAVVERFTFPDEVASHTSSFLNDIVVDQARGVAFISDAGDGGIVVYDRARKRARRWEGVSTKADPTVPFVIDGVDYGVSLFTTPSDGIALSPDTGTLVYCALQGLRLYSLPTSVLRNFSTSSDEVENRVADLGVRPAPADGLAFSEHGNLYLGGLTTAAVYKLPSGGAPASAVEFVEQNDLFLQWPDTFAFDGYGSIVCTTNRLDRFFTRTMDPAEVNYRVVSLFVGENGYLAA